MVNDSIEISLKGKWIRVPALYVSGKTIVVTGRWIKVAAIHDEQWLDAEVEDPETCVEKLKQQGSPRLQADIFTFTTETTCNAPQI